MADETPKFTPEPEIAADERVTSAIEAAFTKPADAPTEGKPDPAADPEKTADEVADTAKPDPAVEKTDEEKAAEAKAAEDKAAADKAKADEAAGKEDLETLPEGVKEATRRRFEVLKEKHNADKAALAETVAERDQLKSDAQQWSQIITSTGAPPEQFQDTLQFLRDWNSGTRDGLERCYDGLMRVAKTIGGALGREIPGLIDPLESYPDLKEKVETMALDRDGALEIARARAAHRLDQAANQQRSQSFEAQQARETGAASLKEACANFAATDPHYAARAPYLGAILRPILQSGAPPSQWTAMLRESYNALPAPVAAAPAAAVIPPAAAKSPDPIRQTGAPGASVTKEPKSMLEAVMLGREAWRG
jgi:hypothetical protein